MALNSSDASFVRRRELMARRRPLAGSGLLLAPVPLAGWLYLSTPRFIDPWRVAADLEAAAISRPTLETMALLLPVTVLLLLGFGIAVVLMLTAVFANGRRPVRLLRGIGDD